MQFILVAGVPRAGKSSFADWVVEHDERFAHIPLDRYILPLGTAGPKESAEAAFLAWVREPSCIDWDLLAQHVAILAAGDDCRTPKSDWSKNGVRLSMGGRGRCRARALGAGGADVLYGRRYPRLWFCQRGAGRQGV